MTNTKTKSANISQNEFLIKNENSGWLKICMHSGLIGGLISVFSHILSIMYTIAGIPANSILVVTLLTLLLLGAVTTRFGWYDKLNKYGMVQLEVCCLHAVFQMQ